MLEAPLHRNIRPRVSYLEHSKLLDTVKLLAHRLRLDHLHIVRLAVSLPLAASQNRRSGTPRNRISVCLGSSFGSRSSGSVCRRRRSRCTGRCAVAPCRSSHRCKGVGRVQCALGGGGCSVALRWCCWCWCRGWICLSSLDDLDVTAIVHGKARKEGEGSVAQSQNTPSSENCACVAARFCRLCKGYPSVYVRQRGTRAHCTSHRGE